MARNSGSLLKSRPRCRASGLRSWVALWFMAATLAGCGEIRRNSTDHARNPDGAAASSGVGGTFSAGGSNSTGGSVAGYYRFVRLTNSQWAKSVQEVLRLAKPSGLEQAFSASVSGTTDFSNNELVLYVDARGWADFEAAAEALAEQVTASDAALAAVYPDTDATRFIKTVGRRAYRRPLTAAENSTYTALSSIDGCTS